MIDTLIRIFSPRMKWTEQHQRTFRYLLTKVPVKAYQYENNLAIRPVNVGKFKELCDKEGIGECAEVGRMIRVLQNHPGEWIRFEHEV